jgi:HK97 family phage prohead protease
MDSQMILDADSRHVAPTVGSVGMSLMDVRSINAETRSVRALLSTPHIDRYEEIVEPKAFLKWLPTFKRSPVCLAGHVTVGQSGEPTTIGSWSDLEVTDEGLIGTVTFGVTELAQDYWLLYRDGHMKAFSVGWITKAWEFRPGPENKSVRVFTEVELIEVSAVAIPANRQSLVRAASALSSQRAAPTHDMISELRQVISDEIAKRLNTDPGSPLQVLIADVMAAAGGAGDHVCSHDVDPQSTMPKVAEALKTGVSELKRIAGR